MKTLRFITITIFIAILLLPILYFNFTPNSVSTIDNRMLAENPFTLTGDLTLNIENYVNDRIGFRDEMIYAYTISNDILFKKMVHPIYVYGQDGYVFGRSKSNHFSDFHIIFAELVKSIQDYCNNHNIPFLFVFNPEKSAIYQSKLPVGLNYSREWVDSLFLALDEREINYLDNTITFQTLSNSGIECFNKKFDAGHWNDIGAFYGTQKILLKMQEVCPTVHVNELSEFTIAKVHKESLPVSNFPINEDVPSLSYVNAPVTKNLYSDYSGINLHPSFQTFGYTINENRVAEDSPKVLVFQGSYMNGFGLKYFANSFGEYIYVHDYQNVIDFPYYFNIFQPDCVVFEVAEYTLLDQYFSYNEMKAVQYNPALSTLDDTQYHSIEISESDIVIEQNKELTKITWNSSASYKYVWATIDNTYDMKAIEGGYQVTINTIPQDEIKNLINIFVSNEKK